MKPLIQRALAVLVFMPWLILAAEEPTGELFLRVRNDKGQERLTAEKDFRRSNTNPTTASPEFMAVVSSAWPPGLVPMFAVMTEGSFQLRRLPPRGQENWEEPLFFALPPADESHATNIAGLWSCSATNAQGNKHYPDWELAIDHERIAGRFSQHGEYRVAFITGGTFRSNRFELKVDYINDHYSLNGEWNSGKLFGTWRQLDNEENGIWEATRPTSKPAVLPTTKAVPLFEWLRGHERRYSVEATLDEPGWTRAIRPLCRVWQSK